MIIIHDKRLPAEYIRALKAKMPFISLIPFSGPGDQDEVYDSISCHPDIYVFQLDERTLIYAPCLQEDQLYIFRSLGMELIKGESAPCGSYPYTARYNAARVGKVMFHNLRHTDPVISEKARSRGLKTVHVAQGYTRCSVLAVNERALITSDKGIAVAASEEGMDILLVSPGLVLLPGEEYGFIGGASGKAPNGTIFLLGDLRPHPDGFAIKRFLAKHSVGLIELEGLPLYDAGGLVIV